MPPNNFNLTMPYRGANVQGTVTSTDIMAGAKKRPAGASTYYGGGNSSENMGGIADSLGAALGFAGNIRDVNQHYKNMQFLQPTQLNAPGEMPSYSGISGMRKDAYSIDPSTAGKGLVGEGVMAGAKVGATVGSMIPGLGTVIGGGIGAATGLVAGLFGKNAAKKNAEDAQQRGIEAFETAQDDYNLQVGDYYSGVQEKRQDIQGERAYQQRLYGIGNFNSPFASII
jgi:hypothetical protein